MSVRNSLADLNKQSIAKSSNTYHFLTSTKNFAIDLVFQGRIQNKIIASKNGYSKWCNSLKYVTFDLRYITLKYVTLAVLNIIKNFNICIVNNVLQNVNGILMESDAAKFIGISMGASVALVAGNLSFYYIPWEGQIKHISFSINDG